MQKNKSKSGCEIHQQALKQMPLQRGQGRATEGTSEITSRPTESDDNLIFKCHTNATHSLGCRVSNMNNYIVTNS